MKIIFIWLPEMVYTEKKTEQELRNHGYKITPQRLAVISAIAGSHEHLTPAAIYERVHRDYPSIGLVTIYRTLEMLTELDLICETHAGGSCHSYLMRRPAEHHHHLICSDCGKVVDFTDCDLGDLESRLVKETKFKINGHLLEFIGQCRRCSKNKGS